MNPLDMWVGRQVKIKLSNTSYRSMLAGKTGTVEQVIGGNIGVRFEGRKAPNKSGLFWFDYTSFEGELQECIDP